LTNKIKSGIFSLESDDEDGRAILLYRELAVGASQERGLLNDYPF
jgi:hypothetical protein